MMDNSSIGLQNKVFSVFTTLTIAPPLIQQLQPKYLAAHEIFQSRESNSRIYSWSAFSIAAMVVESPYSFLADTLYWAIWFFVVFGRNPNAAFVWGVIMLFELYYVSFGQAIASFSPNVLPASLLVPLFFTFVVLFCGVLVPFAAFPPFWIFMYRRSPFTYPTSALLSPVLHDQAVTCGSAEFARLLPSAGQTCGQYAGAFVRMAGGYLANPDTTGLASEYCRYSVGDDYLATLNIYFDNRWRDFGVFCAYIAFNFLVVLIASWLYLQGGKSIGTRLPKLPRFSFGRTPADEEEEHEKNAAINEDFDDNTGLTRKGV